jgi:hypothetical protein
MSMGFSEAGRCILALVEAAALPTTTEASILDTVARACFMIYSGAADLATLKIQESLLVAKSQSFISQCLQMQKNCALL